VVGNRSAATAINSEPKRLAPKFFLGRFVVREGSLPRYLRVEHGRQVLPMISLPPTITNLFFGGVEVIVP
jgi:hypothetical protein